MAAALQVGLAATVTHTVTSDDTAVALGSGDVPVLATPRLIAWAEGATVAAVAQAVARDETTVGTKVEFAHLAPSAVGAEVTVTATLAEVDARRLAFQVVASDQTDGRSLGIGRVERVVVDRQRFISKASPGDP